MDINQVLPWIVAANTLVVLATALYAFLTSGAKKTATALDQFKSSLDATMQKLGETIAAQDRRIQVLETEMKHLPDAKAFGDLRLAISELAGKVGRMEENQMGVSRTVHRVEDFLMKQGRDAA